jgi:hypothetical protein
LGQSSLVPTRVAFTDCTMTQEQFLDNPMLAAIKQWQS